jgi:hypothetical protein
MQFSAKYKANNIRQHFKSNKSVILPIEVKYLEKYCDPINSGAKIYWINI